MYYNERKVIRTQPSEFIQRIKYTIIINEDEAKIPGFKKDQIKQLLESVVNINRQRGDVLEIFYMPFSDHLFNFASINESCSVTQKSLSSKKCAFFKNFTASSSLACLIET